MATLISAIPAFPVVQIDKAVDFYETRFVFTCRHKEKHFAILNRGDIELHLWASCDFIWKWRSFLLFAKPIRTGAESFLAGTHSCRIQVKGIDALNNELKAANVLQSRNTVY